MTRIITDESIVVQISVLSASSVVS